MQVDKRKDLIILEDDEEFAFSLKRALKRDFKNILVISSDLVQTLQQRLKEFPDDQTVILLDAHLRLSEQDKTLDLAGITLLHGYILNAFLCGAPIVIMTFCSRDSIFENPKNLMLKKRYKFIYGYIHIPFKLETLREEIKILKPFFVKDELKLYLDEYGSAWQQPVYSHLYAHSDGILRAYIPQMKRNLQNREFMKALGVLPKIEDGLSKLKILTQQFPYYQSFFNNFQIWVDYLETHFSNPYNLDENALRHCHQTINNLKIELERFWKRIEEGRNNGTKFKKSPKRASSVN